MSSREYESYILREEEMKLLLGGLGVKQLYGLLENDRTEESKEEKKNRTISRLYQNGIVEISKRGIVIRPEYSEIFSVLRTSRSCITVHTSKSDIPVRCCYMSLDKIIMTEKCQNEKKTLKVSCWEKEQWLKFVGESMETVATDYVQFSRERSEKVKQKWYSRAEEYLQEKGTTTVFSLQDSRKLEIYQRLLIQEKGLETWLILHNRGNSVQRPYSRDELYNVLRAWMGGKNDTGRYLYSGN